MEMNSKIVLPHYYHVMCLKCYHEWCLHPLSGRERNDFLKLCSYLGGVSAPNLECVTMRSGWAESSTAPVVGGNQISSIAYKFLTNSADKDITMEEFDLFFLLWFFFRGRDTYTCQKKGLSSLRTSPMITQGSDF
ncbi:hypothetical protein GLYMA_06G015750v4 [Glycine max]|nr:hypothetical protein GLYMA_06G015750v4 [Glycine max]KAG5018143.1 hypothetical protein JHK87_013998 [Glycine soja]KAG4389104.1 hypothetical protein GLYMA_06G015750v4 [Glycine max]KAG4389105.1 hypothetical protein GLYMA_06G015750v4 [Glycine max]KAG4389106.1 hypothetical protein GLYMA_06G015750v4 [Glycine max]